MVNRSVVRILRIVLKKYIRTPKRSYEKHFISFASSWEIYFFEKILSRVSLEGKLESKFTFQEEKKSFLQILIH